MPKETVTIRRYKTHDRDSIVSICHRTGYFGEDATPYFKDAELFGLLFSAYYLEYEPSNCFVADDNGTVVGYIIGATDTVSQREGFSRYTVPRIIKRMFTRTLFTHPGDVFFILGLRHHEDYERELYSEDLIIPYPAHLHINILPDYQRRGVGGCLMERFLSEMKAKGVPGVHLVTSTENKKALPFYQGKGFTKAKELPTMLWEKKSPPGVKTLVYTKLLK